MAALTWAAQAVDKNNATLADLTATAESIHEDYERTIGDFGFDDRVETISKMEGEGDIEDMRQCLKELCTDLDRFGDQLWGIEERLRSYQKAAFGTEMRLGEGLRSLEAQLAG